MPETTAPRRARLSAPAPATACAALMLILILIGALLWFVPAFTSRSYPATEVPAPRGLFADDDVSVAGHQSACMPEVGVTANSRRVQFDVFPFKHTRAGGPPMDFVLRGAGSYRSRSHLGGGYTGGLAILPISPPKRSLIVTACFVNLGDRPLVLEGSDEARTISRSVPLTIGGRQVPGDISFEFTADRETDALGLLGTIARHASNLSDGILPPVLIWIFGILVAFGVPFALVFAFRAALAEEPGFSPDAG